MFAKGPRFPPEKPSDIPGPGHYKLPEEFRYDSYKKGAFLEKGDRFSVEKASDVPGSRTYNAFHRDSNPRQGQLKLPSSSNHGLAQLQQEFDALKTQNARLQREHQQAVQKYEDKLMHNESTIKSLVKDNVALQTQMSTQQKDHRAICQREMALKAALEKADSSHKNQADHVRKLAIQQRKIGDLEKLHADDSKKHQSEIERLRAELEVSRRSVTEQSELSSALRKQVETSELRMKDLKNAIIGDQAEIRELQTKLHRAEQSKTQAISRQPELDQAKRNLQTLETRYKTELSDREAKLTQQEKTLATERRRREALELRLREIQNQVDTRAREAEDRHQQLKGELETTKKLLEESKRAAAEDTTQLLNLQKTMALVAKAYGNLAASSTSRAAYRQLQLEHASLQLRNIRLERRLADREALTQQLTDYCRQASEDKTALANALQDAQMDFENSLRGLVLLDENTLSEDLSLIYTVLQVIEEDYNLRESLSQSVLLTTKTLVSLYRTELEDLMVAYMALHKESTAQCAIATRLINACSEHEAEVEALRTDYRMAESAISQKTTDITEAVAWLHASEERVADLQRENARLDEMLKKERELNTRLAHTTHQSRKNEQALQLEIGELMEELQDVTRYKEAHSDLLSEIVELIQRNELAEAEAERLSKFNAEILGHTNPQQKISYMDRIRRELADTKHRLLTSARSRDDLLADNAALQNEVAAYKCISVPDEWKFRRDRVRVERAPLVARDINGFTQDIAFEVTPAEGDQVDTSPMTLDEIT